MTVKTANGESPDLTSFHLNLGLHRCLSSPFCQLPPELNEYSIFKMFCFAFCILDIPKWVLWQTVMSQKAAFILGLHCLLRQAKRKKKYYLKIVTCDPSIYTMICLFDLILDVPVNNLSVMLDGSSWVEPVLSKDQYTMNRQYTKG